MTISDQKSDLRRYLQQGRDAMLWKMDGLSDYDIRRPLTPTGTNLLGMVKHLASCEFGYFGETFGRPSADALSWSESDPNADMFATASESRDFITGLYRKSWAHADVTFDTLDLDAVGHVRWWGGGDRSVVNLHRILIHMIAETHRHAGHADIVREMIDGVAGLRADNSNLPEEEDPAWWATYRSRVEQAARAAAQV
jgi:hypothetical protein